MKTPGGGNSVVLEGYMQRCRKQMLNTMRSRSDMFHLDEQDIDAFFGMYPSFLL